VKVFVGGTGPFTEQLAEREIPFHSLTHLVRPISPLADLKAIRELRVALGEYQPDLISCHSTKAGMVGRIAGSGIRIPTLFTAHGWTFVDGISKPQRVIVRAIEKFCAPKGPKIICVCEDDKRIAIDNGIAPASKFAVIHNGMPDHPERANPAIQPPRIVSVARLDSQKDHGTLFLALAGLTDIPWALDLVGDGPKREEYEGLVRTLGISVRVHFHGAQKNVRSFLANAQLFALISNYEGFPRSTLEAMRTGLPVVVSDVNGSREAIEQGVSGRYVPPRDVPALQAVLRDLLTAPGMRESMGKVGRTRYEQMFTFDQMMAKTAKVYEEVLGRSIQL
jgi:glycosyltransferase involved in cell wall biosynthesis